MADYLITDACDELGNGVYTIRVDQSQLNDLLARDIVYEDTTSDYISLPEQNGRRHFHPSHNIVNVVTEVYKMEIAK